MVCISRKKGNNRCPQGDSRPQEGCLGPTIQSTSACQARCKQAAWPVHALGCLPGKSQVLVRAPGGNSHVGTAHCQARAVRYCMNSHASGSAHSTQPTSRLPHVRSVAGGAQLLQPIAARTVQVTRGRRVPSVVSPRRIRIAMQARLRGHRTQKHPFLRAQTSPICAVQAELRPGEGHWQKQHVHRRNLRHPLQQGQRIDGHRSQVGHVPRC
jgi:hypothetical protein